MKFLKLAVAAAFAFGFGNAYAFHSGGVAECDGCHTMHNSEGGVAMTAIRPQFQAGPYLLQGNTQSEACLNCHQHAGDTGPSSYHISTADVDMQLLNNGTVAAVPRQMTPGGDFGWIRADVPFAVRGTPTTNFGEERGHNIVAPFYGYNAQVAPSAAPGGTYLAANLQCSSCHDPHGKTRILDVTNAYTTQATTGGPIMRSGSYPAAVPPAGYTVGVYRLLGGAGYAPKSYNAGAFSAPSPVALAPSTYNKTELTSETVATYGMGMSEFCANCHPSMLMNGYTSGMAGLRHPAGNGAPLTAAVAANYVAYVKSGVLTGVAPNYTSLVPFETGVANLTTLGTTTGNFAPGNGPAAATTSNVVCLSCHRAHASGFKSMIRFGHENEFMTIADAAGVPMYDTSTTEGKINRGFSTQLGQETQYYGRPAGRFAGYQRLLCNKCHAKD